MDPISVGRPVDLSMTTKSLGASALDKKDSLLDPKDSVTISSKASKSKSSKAGSAHKKSMSVKSHSSGSGELSKSDMPETSRGRRSSGPDDVDDDGACPGGGRRDNSDGPDSTYDGGGCGSSGSSRDSGSYSGPDGTSSYDEFH